MIADDSKEVLQVRVHRGDKTCTMVSLMMSWYMFSWNLDYRKIEQAKKATGPRHCSTHLGH